MTVLTIAATLVCIAAAVNVVARLSALSVIGFALMALVVYWVIVGCARRGEPLARWLLRRQ